MKTKFASIASIVVAMATVAPAWAADNPVGDLAQISGLSERKVRMILGNRTAFAEYPYTYQRSLEKFTAAIGKDNTQRLMNGEAVALRDRQGQTRVVQISRRPVDKTL